MTHIFFDFKRAFLSADAQWASLSWINRRRRKNEIFWACANWNTPPAPRRDASREDKGEGEMTTDKRHKKLSIPRAIGRHLLWDERDEWDPRMASGAKTISPHSYTRNIRIKGQDLDEWWLECIRYHCLQLPPMTKMLLNAILEGKWSTTDLTFLKTRVHPFGSILPHQWKRPTVDRIKNWIGTGRYRRRASNPQ